jgi:hypothetical protein
MALTPALSRGERAHSPPARAGEGIARGKNLSPLSLREWVGVRATQAVSPYV